MEPNNLRANLPKPTELFSYSWNFIKTHAKIFVTIAAIPAILAVLAEVLNSFNMPVLTILSVLTTFIYVVISIATQASLIDAIRKLSNNPSEMLTVTGQYKYGFSVFWSLIILAIIQILSTFGAFFLLIIPGIILMIYTSFYMFAFVIEGKKGFDAFIHSYNLVKGNWFPVFGRILLLTLSLGLLVFLIDSGIGFLVKSLLHVASHSEEAVFIQSIIKLIVYPIAELLALVYFYRMYESLKNFKTAQLQELQASTDKVSFKNLIIAAMVVGVFAVFIAIIVGFIVAIAYGVSTNP